MENIVFSIIIPAYNKADSLEQSLANLARQTMPDDEYEVIVVDDGSTDVTEVMVAAQETPYLIHYLKQRNQGASVARNTGVSLAKGKILFFLDADIWLNEDALAEHLRAHFANNRVLVAGRILPLVPNSIQVEDLYYQRYFDFGPDARTLHWRDVKTQALSMKKEHFFEIGPFDKDLRRGQDVEFGYRAVQKGFEIKYCPHAIGIHNHQLSFKARCETERRDHRYLAAFFQKYPELTNAIPHLVDKWPIYWGQDSPQLILRKTARRISASNFALSKMHIAWTLLVRVSAPEWMLRFLYWKIIGGYQLLGLREGITEYGL